MDIESCAKKSCSKESCRPERDTAWVHECEIEIQGSKGAYIQLDGSVRRTVHLSSMQGLALDRA